MIAKNGEMGKACFTRAPRWNPPEEVREAEFHWASKAERIKRIPVARCWLLDAWALKGQLVVDSSWLIEKKDSGIRKLGWEASAE